MRNKAVLTIIFFGMVVGFLVIGLWPLDFSPGNLVWWSKDGRGLYFQGRTTGSKYSSGGVIYTRSPLDLPKHSSINKASLTIELWLRAATATKTGTGQIFSLCDGFDHEQLFIYQWKSHMIIFRRFSKTQSQHGDRKVGVRDVLKGGATHFITITSNGTGVAAYMDGKLVEIFRHISFLEGDKNFSGKTLLLGNSLDATRSWSGDIFGIGLYARAFTGAEVERNYHWWKQGRGEKTPFASDAIAVYRFERQRGRIIQNIAGPPNPLYMPRHLRFKDKFLGLPELPYRSAGSFIKDGLVNIVGFIPLSFFLLLWLRGFQFHTRSKVYVIAVISGFLVSLGIELIQGYMPCRDSSLVDLVNNTLGAILGVILFHMGMRDVVD